MHNYIKKIIPILVVAAIITAALSTRAQESPNCPDLVIKALETTSTQCLDIGRNEACYGNVNIQATPRDDVPADQFVFNAPGDRIKLDLIKTLRLGELNLETQEWGVGYMRIRANLPDVAAGQFVTMILFGDTAIRDASVEMSEKTGKAFTPMQAFYFRTGIGGEADRPLCNEFPTSGILIQTPQGGQKVELMVNEVRLSVGSTILLEAPGSTKTLGELEDVDETNLEESPPSEMLVTTFEGEVEIEVNGKTVTVGTGEQGSIPLDENSRPAGDPEKKDTPDVNTYGALINLVNKAADKELITFVGEVSTPVPTEAATEEAVRPVAGIPATSISLGGAGQSVPVGGGFANPLQVKVVDFYGTPVSGATVVFSGPASGPGVIFGTLAMIPAASGPITLGGGTGLLAPGSTSATVTTDANGVATSPEFSANTIAGTYIVTARELSKGVSTGFSLTNLPGYPVQLAKMGGDGQSTTVNTPFGSPLVVKVMDGYGNGVPGSSVYFYVYSQGAGAIFSGTGGESESVVTDANGNAASSALIANDTPGEFFVDAYGEGEFGTSFTLTNLAPPPPTATFTPSPTLTPTLTQTPTLTLTPTATFTATMTFTPIPPAPSISGISPNTVSAGAAGFTLSVFGSNFDPFSVVLVNGSGRSTSYVSNGQLNAQITSSDVSTSGVVSIQVFTSGAGTSNSASLTVTGAAAGEKAPRIASISPNPVSAGGVSFTLTVNGSNFTPSSGVLVNGAGRTTTFISESTLQVTVLDTDIASPGSVSIQVGSEYGVSEPTTLTVN